MLSDNLLETALSVASYQFPFLFFSEPVQAWDLWDSGRAMEMLDPSIAGSSSQNEVMRCIHIAVLCVQDSASHRPNMAAVVLMLESEHAHLPPPGQPTLTSRRISADLDVWNEQHIDVLSSNDVTLSTILGR